jgi:PKD repeat protein
MKDSMKKSGDSGNLSIDFLVGFTIFLLAFIWVVAMIPGLLINLQAYTIDYDAVAYRTGVILAEDPGVPPIPSWENAPSQNDVVRFGLSLSKDVPHILSEDKVNQFFCTSVFTYPEDYQERVIFGDYPYRFNVSLIETGPDHPSRYVGDVMSGSYGTIRRLVKIKGTSNATINYTYMNTHGYIHGDNETRHEFSIVINNTELLRDKVTNPIYQIDPSKEKFTINITDLNQTMFADREPCFNVSLEKIYIYVVDEKTTPLHHYYNPIINGTQYRDITSDTLYDTELPKDIKNISLVFYPKTVTWSDYSHVYINLTFKLVKTSNDCACPTCPGSQFLNNTPGIPFDYNYHPDNVTQPLLRDAVLEVSVGPGYRTSTESLIKPLAADFTYTIVSGTTVQFVDKSTGTPRDWAWDFNDGGSTSTQNNPVYTFSGPGTYHVKLTVKNAAGDSNGPVSKDVLLLPPVADFTGSPLSGPANPTLPVIFTDTSSNTPTSWKWEYNKTVGGTWTTFSTTKAASNNFPAGTYDVQLTVTNSMGINTKMIPAYISVLPLPIADFTAAPTSGATPITVIFTNNSANGPFTSYKWEHRLTGTIPWTEFGSGGENPTDTFTTPPLVNTDYDIQLTVTNSAGSNTMTKTNYIHVTAVSISHTITASAVGSGTIAPSGAVIVNDMGSQTFTITPNAGNYIASVLVDGVAQGPPIPSSYTFTNVVADHTIAATFAANTPQNLYYTTFNLASNLSEWAQSGSLGTVTRYTGGGSSNPSVGFRNGSSSVQLLGNGEIQKTIPTTGYTSIVVNFAVGVRSFEGGENLLAQWSPDGGTSWITLETWDDTDQTGHLTYYSYTLPAAANNPNFRLRFDLTGAGNSDYGYIDDVRVTGIHI